MKYVLCILLSFVFWAVTTGFYWWMDTGNTLALMLGACACSLVVAVALLLALFYCMEGRIRD